MKTYGLLGRNIEYSFSRNYFQNKFMIEKIPANYRNFDMQNLENFRRIIREDPELSGLNVTIPYKEQIISLLDRLHPVASEIGAVNTVKFENDGSLTGYNTDHFGFTEAIKLHLHKHHQKALILGTGGASKAVAYGLKQLGIPYIFVSRNPAEKEFSYAELSQENLSEFTVIINSTPLGTHPDISEFPPIPIQFITSRHLIFDLVYNPPVTKLMRLAAQQGAAVLNGEQMLVLQAERSWEIWNTAS